MAAFLRMVSYFHALPQLHIFLTICFFLATSDREASNCIWITVCFDIWYLNPTMVFICESFKYEIILVTLADSFSLTSSTLFTPDCMQFHTERKYACFPAGCVQFVFVDTNMCACVCWYIHLWGLVWRPNVDVRISSAITSPSLSLRQSLSLNIELSDLTRLGQQALGSALFSSPTPGVAPRGSGNNHSNWGSPDSERHMSHVYSHLGMLVLNFHVCVFYVVYP